MLYDRKSGEHKSVTAAWDRSADSYAWAHDSKSLFLIAEDQGRSGLFVLELSGGDAEGVLLRGIDR